MAVCAQELEPALLVVQYLPVARICIEVAGLVPVAIHMVYLQGARIFEAAANAGAAKFPDNLRPQTLNIGTVAREYPGLVASHVGKLTRGHAHGTALGAFSGAPALPSFMNFTTEAPHVISPPPPAVPVDLPPNEL